MLEPFTMGKNKQVNCEICLKTMRSDTLKRHMKRHENKPYQKEVTPPQKEVCEKIEYKLSLAKEWL